LTAVVTDQQDCSVITYQFQVIQANVDVPNVFSPNGDQVNDVFRPVALDTRYSDALVLEEMRIFNRWGDLIYLDDQPWDGISSGEEVTADVYFYAMKFKVGETCFVEKKGDVTLLR
jgi:gliding motility-associated-like protein